jgi:hypothetical protein
MFNTESLSANVRLKGGIRCSSSFVLFVWWSPTAGFSSTPTSKYDNAAIRNNIELLEAGVDWCESRSANIPAEVGAGCHTTSQIVKHSIEQSVNIKVPY